MASKEGEAAPAPASETKQEEVKTAAETPATAEAAKPADEAAPAAAPDAADKEAKKAEAAKRRAERAEKRKEQRKAAREAAKERKAAGIADPKPKAAPKAAKAGALQIPDGAAPKITVTKLSKETNAAELRALFAPYGTILRAEVSNRRGRPVTGTILYNTHGEVRKAHSALNGKHKCDGVNDPLSIQYAKDSPFLGEALKKATDEVASCIKQYEYKPSVLNSRAVKDLINRMVLARKKAPETELLTAAVLVTAKAATPEELVEYKLISSVGPVKSLLSEKAPPPATGPVAERGGRSKNEATSTLDKTFDAVVPHLDKLEEQRWNRMAKANLKLNERHRFRFVDILATPSLELWRWMVEDCRLTPAEAGTCFAILQKYYGFTK